MDMNKLLLGLIGFGLSIGLGILIMIFGWGLEPISWGWVVWGNIGSALVAGLFLNAD